MRQRKSRSNLTKIVKKFSFRDDIMYILKKGGASMARTFNGVSSGVNLTTDFFLKNFYRYNRNAVKTSTRSDYTKTELSYEDTRALKRALAKLSSFDYTEDENGDNIVSTIQAFVKTYNYTMESTSSESSDTYRQNRQLKALTKKYGDDLKDIGISINDDGTLDLSDNILKKSSFKEIRNVFSDESGYVKNLRNIAKRMNNTSYDEIYTQLTGSGGKLNIVL